MDARHDMRYASRMRIVRTLVVAVVALALLAPVSRAFASGGSGKVETVTVTKAYTNATATSGGELLIKASSTNTSAILTAYRPDGSVIGFVVNGGGGKYGGTVMAYQSYDPIAITVRSSTGASVTVPTTAFGV